MAAHDQKSPLEMAIKNRQMDFWNIMRENTELTENEKLVQLRRMIMVENMEEDNPSKEFKELLSSLPVEMVNTTCIEVRDSFLPENTLMQVAAACNNTGVARLLLEKGVDPKARGGDEKTAMEIATEHESEEVVNLLCGAIGEETPDNVKLQQLSKALYREDTEKFKTVLSSLSPELVSTTAVNSSGSVLQDAVSEGKTDFVRLLLEHGVDAAVATDEKGETPLEIVWNTLFWTDEDSGMERNFTEIAGLLCKATGEFSDDMKLRRLLEAMYEEDKYDGMEHFIAILSSLSPELVSNTAVNRYGSVLRNAVVRGKTDFIRLLLEKRVDPNIKDTYSRESPMQSQQKGTLLNY